MQVVRIHYPARRPDIDAIFPGIIGINLVLAGGRFLWFNLGIRETERARRERLAKAEPGGGGLT